MATKTKKQYEEEIESIQKINIDLTNELETTKSLVIKQDQLIEKLKSVLKLYTSGDKRYCGDCDFFRGQGDNSNCGAPGNLRPESTHEEVINYYIRNPKKKK